MSNQRKRSVLEGKPTARQHKDQNGQTIITVTLKALSPFMAKIADCFTLLVTIMFGLFAIAAALAMQDSSLFNRFAVVAAPLPAYFAIKHVLYHLLAKTKRVTFTSDTIAYRRFLMMRRFDSKLPIKFTLHAHPRADREKHEIALREQRRKNRWYTRPIKPYYQNANLLVLEYMGQPNVVMSIYGVRKGEAIIARLMAVSEVIEGYDGSARGTATSPTSDWGTQAGGLVIDHHGGTV